MSTDNKAMFLSFLALTIVQYLTFIPACMFVLYNTTNDHLVIRMVCLIIAVLWSLILGFAVQHDVEWRVRGWND